jgi:phosphoglucomutase
MPYYTRIDRPATAEQRRSWWRSHQNLSWTSTLAGEPIIERLAHAPGNGASIGGLKVVSRNGWFAGPTLRNRKHL